jgi:hypothetical protein
VLGGGKFANGAVSGAFSYMFNQQGGQSGWGIRIKRFFGGDPDGGFLGTSLTPREFIGAAGTGASQGAGVWFDRVIPGAEPFADYFKTYDPLDPNLQASQFLGAMGQQAVFTLAAAGVARAWGFTAEIWRYKGAGGAGLNILRRLPGAKPQSIIRFDLHRLGKPPNQVWRPHVDIPSKGVKHWPWNL